MRKVLLILLAVLVTACSARAGYENLQINRRNECMKLPPARYDACMEGVQQSYDEYERERQEYLKEREEYRKEKVLEEKQRDESL